MATSEAPAPELKTYTGSCACSAFTYTVQLPELTSVFECDCSICARKGYKWAFPGEGCFTVLQGEGKLKTYEFAGKTMAHMFCPVCGTGVYGTRHGAPAGMNMGLNLRTINGVDILSIPVGQTFNGRALPPTYSPPTTALTGTYVGSCHCKAMVVSFSSDLPIEEQKITECTCASCVRLTNRHPHLTDRTPPPQPPKSSVTIEHLSPQISDTYNPAPHSQPNTKESAAQTHTFCSVCGVHVYAESPSASGQYMLNMRCFPESVIDLGKLKVERVGVEAA